jgi:hypothetical protein
MDVRLFLAVMAVMGAALTAPAAAVESRPRLVVGSIDGPAAAQTVHPFIGQSHTELYRTGSLSLGTLLDQSGPVSSLALPFDGSRDRLAVGGFAAFGRGDTRVGTSLRGDGTTLGADVFATYSGQVLGVDGVTALRLGADWAQPSGLFSPNTVQAGFNLGEPAHAGSDVSLSLSWTRPVTPALSLGGVATATQPVTADTATPSGTGFMLGAGLGYKF